MPISEMEIKDRFRIGFGKDVETEHFPITVASGLDALLKPNGYKRLPHTEPYPEEFIWENGRGERFIVDYYTKVNAIARSTLFDEDKDLTEEDTTERLSTIYDDLNATIGTLSQHLGSPYISSTHELRLEIEGSNPIGKAQFVIPVVRELYKKTEGMQVISVDILDQTDSTVQILFGYQE